MVHAHCMLETKATDTHSEYVIGTAFPQQQMLHGCTLKLCLYIYCIFYLFLYSAHSLLIGNSEAVCMVKTK